MRRLKLLNTQGLLALILLAASISTFTVEAKEQQLWKKGPDYVGLKSADTTQANSHPVEIDSNKLYQILSNVRIQKDETSLFDLKIFDSKDDYSSEMFSRDELLSLSQNVSRGLSLASTREDVIFSITGAHQKTIGKASVTTTGRIFYIDGVLHLIIGEFRVELAQKYRRSGGYSDVAETIDVNKLNDFKLDTASRTKSINSDFTFLESDFQKIHQPTSGKTRNDWLEIDLENELISYTKKDVSTKGSSETVGSKRSEDNYQHLESKIEHLEKRLDEKNDSVVKPSNAMSNTPKQSIEDRLLKLKDLYSKGLINEESYNSKVKNILSEL